MKLLWKYSKKYWPYILLNFVSVGGFVLTEIGLPTLLSQALNIGFITNDMSYVFNRAVWMILFTLGGLAGMIILGYSTNRIASGVIRDIRRDIYRKAQEFSHTEYETIGVSRMITNTTNDPYQIMMFLSMALRIGIMTPIMCISSFVMIFIHGGSMAYIVLGALPFLVLGVVLIAKQAEPLSVAQQTGLDNINLTMREGLTGLRVIRAFNNEGFQEDRFDAVNKRYTNVAKKVYRLMALSWPAFTLIFAVMMIIVIWLGAKQVDVGIIQFGTLSAFIEYIWHALFSFVLFAVVFIMYPRAAVSAKRIQDILDAKPAITENPNGISTTNTRGIVEFKNVSFAYSDNSENPVLNNVSFTALPGETVAFMGSTGSGKSTLIQLIPRFFDVTGGSILIDGHDIRDYRLSALRDKIGYIPQKAILFSGTIAENIRYGNPTATMEELEEAAEIAQAKDFIHSRPDQYEDYLAEGGTNLSGGQKQRLSIARAVAKKPAIYVFDDSFSALDYQTDANLRARLQKETTESTVLIVAQRVGTIMDADKIVVLDKGSVVGIGTHKELLKSCEIYYEIASSQLTKEELE